jgi:2-polyprenyl-3-methyl-5-hydroxy-6-metoxy-1,4-benzoquinol methylase
MKIAYSCVVDSHPKFEWQALLWAHSLLRNGNCRADNLKIHCLPGVTKNFRESLNRLNVEIIEILPFEGGHVYCNKIQQCFSGAFRGFDKAVLTDTDLFFLSPPSVPDEAVFAGKTVDLPVPPLKILQSIYRIARIPFPKEVLVECALSDEEKTFQSNVNGGFYYMDASLIQELGRTWKKQALWLIDHGSSNVHVDQVALAMALDVLNVDIKLLSAEINCPIHLPEERLQRLKLSQIQVIHYHNRVLPSGEIMPSHVPDIDKAINRANRGISAIINENMDNLLFWNNRYACFPELGSGFGSRGEILQYKRGLLNQAVFCFKDQKVLEIGCGDLETSKGLGFINYTGYDLSEAALEIARTKEPKWRFIQGSPQGENEILQADLVICLDVLIHQKGEEDYFKLLSNLVSLTKKRLIVSGFETKPEIASNITAFHEPLSRTLRRFDVFGEVMEIGRYRDVSIFTADKMPSGPARHQSDMPLEIFNAMAPLSEQRDLLRFIMDCSRSHLGFFTRTSSRAIEYPWLMEKMNILPVGSRILDIGSGVSPIPIMLAERGLLVSCVDAHPRVRRIENQKEWNEWGYLDYSLFSPHLRSFYTDIQTFAPKEPFDAIYSISVLEHMPRRVWERTLEQLPRWLKPNGYLFLTLDLIPGTYALWNKSEGRVVDPPENHGGLKDITERLTALGFAYEELSAKQNIPYSQTDVAFLKCWLKPSAQVNEKAMGTGLSPITQERSQEPIHLEKSASAVAASVRRRLFLHIGSPKTGTSHLQSFLFENYENLRFENILYPKSLIGSAVDPKHQPLFASLFTGNEKLFYDLLQRMAHETNGSTGTLILSSEGFYHHINEFTESSWRLLKSFSDLFEFKVVVYLRPQSEYMESMYRQYMKNPRGVNAEFGSSLTIYEMLERPKLRQNLDYYDSLMKWAAVVGEKNILVRRYTKNVVEDFMTLLKLEIREPKKANRTNPSITREMAELLRQINDSADEKKRGFLISRMEDYLGDHPEVSDQPILSPRERAALMTRFREGNTLLAQKWFKEDELFPERRIVAESPWCPMTARQDVLINLLQQLSG